MAEQTLKTLGDQGWHITTEGYDLLSENGAKNDLRIVTELLLDTDIKDYGKPVLTTVLNNAEVSGKIVLQIQKVKNISAPKSNQDSQTAPRMLKFILTDGHAHCQAVEIDNLPFLNHNKTPPGSKLLIKKASVNSGYLFLEENSCLFLGGKVQSMYEKWEVNKMVAKHNRTTYDGEGPPPWVSFGQKIQSSINNQPFKSLDNKQKIKENSEFDAQRQDAIAEASSGAVKKVFGGGVRQLQNANEMKERKQQSFRERTNDRKGKRELQKEEKLQKPPEKVSLFDFLETKLPVTEELPTYVAKNLTSDVEIGSNFNKSNNFYGKFNQPRNTYPNNPTNNWQPRNSYNNFQQEYNYPRNHNYNNQQSNNYNNQRNTQYKSNPQYQPRRIDEKNISTLTENFQQMNVRESYGGNQQDKVQNSPIKSTNERGPDRNMNVNSEFASRSFKMHLNIKTDSPRRSNPDVTVPKVEIQEFNRQDLNTRAPAPNVPITWKVGDQCMAKYWEDKKFYRATITGMTNRTCLVQFNDYGNFEEVSHGDCLPLQNEQQGFNKRQSSNTMEFRRGGNRAYNNNKNFGKPK